jgi:hypothetical protein
MADSKTVVPYNPGPYTPPPYPTPAPRPSPPPQPPQIAGWAKQVYIPTNTGIFYTANFSGPGGAMPMWTTVNTGLPTTNIWRMTADPFAPKITQYAITYEPYYTTYNSNRIYRRQNSGSWVLILNNEALKTLFGVGANVYAAIVAICTDVNTPGYLAVCWEPAPGGMGWHDYHYAFSTNYGTTWQKHNTTRIGSDLNGNVRGFGLGLFKGASAYPAGHVVYLSIYSGGGGTHKLFVSVNRGETWTERSNFAADVGSHALQLDLFQDIVYAYSGFGIQKSINRGLNWTVIAEDGTYPDIDQLGQFISGYQIMPLYLSTYVPYYAKTIRVVGSSGDIWKTTTAGPAWTRTVAGAGWGSGGYMHQKGILVLGNEDGKVYGIDILPSTYGGTTYKHSVQVTPDEGATWTGKGGTNYATPPFASSIPGNATVRGILPVG